MTSSSEERRRRRKSRKRQSRKSKIRMNVALMKKIEKMDKDLKELKDNICPSRKRTRSSSSSASSETSSNKLSGRSSRSSSSENENPRNSLRHSRENYRSKSVGYDHYDNAKYSRGGDGSRRLPNVWKKRHFRTKRSRRDTSHRSSTSHRDSAEKQSGSEKNKNAEKDSTVKNDASETKSTVSEYRVEKKSKGKKKTDDKTNRCLTGDKIAEVTMDVDDEVDENKSTKNAASAKTDGDITMKDDVINSNKDSTQKKQSAKEKIVDNKQISTCLSKAAAICMDIVDAKDNEKNYREDEKNNESRVQESKDRQKNHKEKNAGNCAVARKSYAKHKIHQRHEKISENLQTSEDRERRTITEDVVKNIINKKSSNVVDSSNETSDKKNLTESLLNSSKEKHKLLETPEKSHKIRKSLEIDKNNSNVEELSKVKEISESNLTPQSIFVEESMQKIADPNIVPKSSIGDEKTSKDRVVSPNVLETQRDSLMLQIRSQKYPKVEGFNTEKSSSRNVESDEDSRSENTRNYKRLKPNPADDVPLLPTRCAIKNNSPTVQSIVTLSRRVITVRAEKPVKIIDRVEDREFLPEEIANESFEDIFSEDTDCDSKASEEKFELSNEILKDRIASTLEKNSDIDEEKTKEENPQILGTEKSVSNITESVNKIEESTREKLDPSNDVNATEDNRSTVKQISDTDARRMEDDTKENLDPETPESLTAVIDETSKKIEDSDTSTMKNSTAFDAEKKEIELTVENISVADRQSKIDEFLTNAIEEKAEENLYPEIEKSSKEKITSDATEEFKDSELSTMKIIADIRTKKQKDELPIVFGENSEKKCPMEVFRRDEKPTIEISQEKSVEDSNSRDIEESKNEEENSEETANGARAVPSETPEERKMENIVKKDEKILKNDESVPIVGDEGKEKFSDTEVETREKDGAEDSSHLSKDEILSNENTEEIATIAETEKKMRFEISNREELFTTTISCSANQPVEDPNTFTMEITSNSANDEISKIAITEEAEKKISLVTSNNEEKIMIEKDEDTSMMKNLSEPKSDESIDTTEEIDEKMNIDFSDHEEELTIEKNDSTFFVNEKRCAIENMAVEDTHPVTKKDESLPIDREEDAKKRMIIDCSDEFVESADNSMDSTIDDTISIDEFLTDEAESEKDENSSTVPIDNSKKIINFENSPYSEGSTREKFETASECSTAKLSTESAMEETSKTVSQTSTENSSVDTETDGIDLILKIDETDESKSINNEDLQTESSAMKNSFCSSEIFSEKNSCSMDETDENDRTLKIDDIDENDTTLKIDDIDENDTTLKFDESPPRLSENKEKTFYSEDFHNDEELAKLTTNQRSEFASEAIEKIEVCRDVLIKDKESKINAEISNYVEKSMEENFQNSSGVLAIQGAISSVKTVESDEVSKPTKSPIAPTQSSEVVIDAKIAVDDFDASNENLEVSKNISSDDSRSVSKASSIIEQSETSMNIDDMEMSSDDSDASDDGNIANSTIIAASTPNAASRVKNDETSTIVRTEETTKNIIADLRNDDIVISDDTSNTTSKFFATSTKSTMMQQSAKNDRESIDNYSFSMSFSNEKIANIDEESKIAAELLDINFDDDFLYEKYVESSRQVIESTSASATETTTANDAPSETTGTEVAVNNDETSIARVDDTEKVVTSINIDDDNKLSNDKTSDTMNVKSFENISKLSEEETSKKMDVDSPSAVIESFADVSKTENEILDKNRISRITAILDEKSATKNDETTLLIENEEKSSKNIETRDSDSDDCTIEKLNVTSAEIPVEVTSETEKVCDEDTTAKSDENIDETIAASQILPIESPTATDKISNAETAKNDESLREENAENGMEVDTSSRDAEVSIATSNGNNEVADEKNTCFRSEETGKNSQLRDEESLSRDFALSSAVECTRSVNIEETENAETPPEKDESTTIQPILVTIAKEPTKLTEQSVAMDIDDEESLSDEKIEDRNVGKQADEKISANSTHGDDERKKLQSENTETVDLSIKEQIEENAIEKSANLREKSPEKNSNCDTKSPEKNSRRDTKSPEKNSRLDTKSPEKNSRLDTKSPEKNSSLDAKSSPVLSPQNLRVINNSIRERETDEPKENLPRESENLEKIDLPTIDAKLVADWTRIMKKGLANSVKENLAKKHLDVNIVFPKTRSLNTQLKRFMSEILMKKDQHYVSTERQLCAAITALGKSITEIKRENLSADMAKNLSDIGEILANLHHENGVERRSCIAPALVTFVDASAARDRVDSFLFEGEEEIEAEAESKDSETETLKKSKRRDIPAKCSLEEKILKTLVESSKVLKESTETSKIDDITTKNDKTPMTKKIADEKAMRERKCDEEEAVALFEELSDIIFSKETPLDKVKAKRLNEMIDSEILSIANMSDDTKVRENTSRQIFKTKFPEISIIDEESEKTENVSSASKNLETESEKMDCNESSTSDHCSVASVIDISEDSCEKPNESTPVAAKSIKLPKVEEKSKNYDASPKLSFDNRSRNSSNNEKIVEESFPSIIISEDSTDDPNNECVVTFARTTRLPHKIEDYDDAVDKISILDEKKKSTSDSSIRDAFDDVPSEKTFFSKDDKNEEPDECVVTFARTSTLSGAREIENCEKISTLITKFLDEERSAYSTESSVQNIPSSSGYRNVKNPGKSDDIRLEDHSYHQSAKTSPASHNFENDENFATTLSRENARALQTIDSNYFSQQKTYQRSTGVKKITDDSSLKLSIPSDQRSTRVYSPKYPSIVSKSINRESGAQEKSHTSSLSLDRISAVSPLGDSYQKISHAVSKSRKSSLHLDESSVANQRISISPNRLLSSVSGGHQASCAVVPTARNPTKQYTNRNAKKLSQDSQTTTPRGEYLSMSAPSTSEKSERTLNYRQSSFGEYSSEKIDNRKRLSEESTREPQSASSTSENTELPRHIRVRPSSPLRRSAIGRSSRTTIGTPSFIAWYDKNNGPGASTSDLRTVRAPPPPRISDDYRSVARKRVTASSLSASRTSSAPQLPHDQSRSSQGNATQSSSTNDFVEKYPFFRDMYQSMPGRLSEIEKPTNNNGGVSDKNKKKGK